MSAKNVTISFIDAETRQKMVMDISDDILKVVNLFDEVTNSDLQGISEASAMNIIRMVEAEIKISDPKKSNADYFIPTLAANVDNEKLSDADFRRFVRNSLPGLV